MSSRDILEEFFRYQAEAEREFDRATGEHTKNLDPLMAYAFFGDPMPRSQNMRRFRALVLWHYANSAPVDKALSEIAEFLVWYHESNMSGHARLADVKYLDKSNRTMPHVAVREGGSGSFDEYRRMYQQANQPSQEGSEDN